MGYHVNHGNSYIENVHGDRFECSLNDVSDCLLCLLFKRAGQLRDNRIRCNFQDGDNMTIGTKISLERKVGWKVLIVNQVDILSRGSGSNLAEQPLHMQGFVRRTASLGRRHHYLLIHLLKNRPGVTSRWVLGNYITH